MTMGRRRLGYCGTTEVLLEAMAGYLCICSLFRENSGDSLILEVGLSQIFCNFIADRPRRLMPGEVPLTPRSSRRQAARNAREFEDVPRRRRVPVSVLRQSVD
jgi:hypothetical protein